MSKNIPLGAQANISVEEMTAAGVNLGHKVSKLHPKMKPYVSGIKNNVNIFDLKDDDLDMLDILLQYRTDSTSVYMIDSTSISVISSTIVIDYNNLSTTLSKLIFIYLKFKISHDFSFFDSTALFSRSGSVLENFYESFVADTIFIYLSGRVAIKEHIYD